MILEEDYGIRPSDITWVRGGYEHPGRIEKVSLNLPADVVVENAGPDDTISALLASGQIDAVIGPRAPSCFERGHPDVGYLFTDPQQTATEWYRRTRLFPIMHTLGIRRSLTEKHPWLPVAVFKAFERSKAIALAKLGDTSATKVTLPFVEEQLHAARMLMGGDFWSYGLEPNRHVLNRFLQRHHAEGLSVSVAYAGRFISSSLAGTAQDIKQLFPTIGQPQALIVLGVTSDCRIQFLCL